MTIRCALRLAGALALLLGAASNGAQAHPANLTAAELRIAADGSCRLGLDFDALAFAINDDPIRIPQAAYREALDAAPEAKEVLRAEAEARWREETVLEVDGAPLPWQSTSFPSTGTLFQGAWVEAVHVPTLLEAAAITRLPPGPHRLRVRFPEVIGQVVLTVQPPVGEASVSPVEPGEWSAPQGVALRVSWLTTAWRFVFLGYRHILPEGLDHILFVLGLFLLGGGVRSLLAQVTAFTVAHSVTLGLSLYGIFRLSPRIVEPCIALSIVLIAIDNLRASKPSRHRLVLIFSFGLIHGLGFSTALRDLGLPRSQLAPALAGFNVGIELGQLTVIAGAFFAVGWFRGNPAWYRKYIVIPASVAIGLVALAWTVQRI